MIDINDNTLIDKILQNYIYHILKSCKHIHYSERHN
jgi:hypothetical protein